MSLVELMVRGCILSRVMPVRQEAHFKKVAVAMMRSAWWFSVTPYVEPPPVAGEFEAR